MKEESKIKETMEKREKENLGKEEIKTRCIKRERKQMKMEREDK